MPEPTTGVNYLRFVLHGETDGILMARKRPPSLSLPVPEAKEIRTLLKIMISRGIRKVRLTGDDPALREDLPDILGMVAGLEQIREVALTTRGVGLGGRVEELAERGLQSVNFNIDTLKASRYKRLTGTAGFKDAWGAVEEALDRKLKVKINAVIQRGVNDDEVADFVLLTKKDPIQIRFIEWNSETDMIAPPKRFVSTRESMSTVRPPLIPRSPRALDGPALIYEIPGHRGTVGFIPNVTEHFCPSCNRVGLTDTGEILSCLFGRGLSLMRYLRGDGGTANVTAFIDRVLRRKEVLATKMAGMGISPAGGGLYAADRETTVAAEAGRAASGSASRAAALTN